jgi:hypothetical protein
MSARGRQLLITATVLLLGSARRCELPLQSVHPTLC